MEASQDVVIEYTPVLSDRVKITTNKLSNRMPVKASVVKGFSEFREKAELERQIKPW